jgi:hypothetical protein
MTEPTAPAAPTAPTAPAAPTTPAAPTRRLHLLAGLRWVIARSLAILVFVAGLALGYNAFLANQPAPIAAMDPATDGSQVPPIVQEFVAALAQGDEAAMRSAVPADPYQLLIAEMSRWELRSMHEVEVLATAVDGPRTATELVISGIDTSGNPVSINLVVHTDDGQISSFR